MKEKRAQFTTCLRPNTLSQLKEIAQAFDRDRCEVIEILVGTFHSRSFKKVLKKYLAAEKKGEN